MWGAHSLGAIVMEAAEEEDAVLMHSHPVSRARVWAALARQLLPCVGVQVEPPQIPVVLELFLTTAER